MPETKMTARDGKPGCPVTVWDGPYSTRCGAGAAVGKCAHHGPFATTAPETTDAPKPTLTEAELDALELADILGRLLHSGGLARTAARHSLMKALEGWVSPEEAKAREAAARREAIEDVAAVMDLSYEYVADLVERQAGR